MKNKASISAAVLMLFAAQAMAETGYVQSRTAKLLASPAARAEVVTELVKGDAVEVVETQGRWLKVSSGDKTGWISKLLVKNQPPKGKISVLEENKELEENARRRASTVSSAAAARGLRNEERARQSDDSVADFSAVREMESERVSEQEAMEFMEQGLER